MSDGGAGFREAEGEREEITRLRAERDQLAASLQAQREQLRVAFDFVPAAVGVVSIPEARFAYVNQAWADFFGVPVAEILASDPYQFLITRTHPEDLLADRQLYQRLADGEITSYQLEKRYLVGEGDVRWGQLALAGARDANGRLAYVIPHITDIHDRKLAEETRIRLEERLRQSQKLEALGQLAGGIAHDFNNRLVVVMGYVELLRQELPSGSPLAEYADQILVGAQRSAELTRQLLAFSRNQLLKPSSFDVHRTLDGMRRMLQRLLGERIELVTILGAKRAAYGDPGQVEQVIMNLAVNARDAMPDGGRLIFETRDPDRLPDDLRPGEYVAVSVTDTGTGIAPDMVDRIFEPFFTTKDATKGTGLGLAMVDGIVRQSGGCVTVTSHVGRGTTFTVFLPAARPEAEAHHEKVLIAQVKPGRAETVLVCDDDESVRRLMCDVLRLGGYQVVEARDGHQGIEVASQPGARIDALVSDVVMPRMEGPELARRLRESDPTLAVLFVSGWVSPETAQQAASVGDLLTKPFLPGDLLRTLRAALDHRAAPVAAAVVPRAT